MNHCAPLPPMEIERKFLIRRLPPNLDSYEYLELEQGYLCTNPVVRVRKEGDAYVLTYKGKGKMMREEYNLPLSQEAYSHLLAKADGNLIHKRRYRIPLGNHIVELDLFSPPHEGLMIAEVEFDHLDDAKNFIPPDWFAEEVTQDKHYHNSYLSRHPFKKI